MRVGIENLLRECERILTVVDICRDPVELSDFFGKFDSAFRRASEEVANVKKKVVSAHYRNRLNDLAYAVEWRRKEKGLMMGAVGKE